MNEALQVAISAAKAAGRIQEERRNNLGQVDCKGRPGDLVTEVDHLCEKEIIRQIKERFPDHSILAEESGIAKGNEPHKWIIDPLDGTLNYSHGYPCYCVSIGLESNGELELGVVYNHNLDELFVAEKGKGATLNGKPISVSTIPVLKESLLVTGFTPQIVGTLEDNIEHFANLMKACQAVRRPGSAAMDLVYTAMGRFEGFWEMKLKPWDTAAGVLILLEAGGKVSRFDGSPYSIYDPDILVSNGNVHQQMVDVLTVPLRRRAK